MKKILVMTLAFMMITGQASAFGGFAGLLTILNVGMMSSAVYSYGAGDRFRADNLWYDPKADFSKINSIVVFPLVAPNQDDISQQTITRFTHDRIMRKLKEMNPVFVVDYKAAAYREMAAGKNMSQIDMFTEDDAAAAEKAVQEYDNAINPVNYPALLEPFESEAERGAAVRAETGANTYLTWRLSEIYDPDEYKMPKKKIKGEYWQNYSYAYCTYSLRSANGNEIMAYSAIVPVATMNGAASLPDVAVAFNGFADELKDLRKEKEPKDFAGGKILRIGTINVPPSGNEESGVMKRSLNTAVRQQAEDANLFRAVTDAESDYIVEADITDCTVKKTCTVKKSGMSEFEVKAHIAATVKLINAKSGLAVSTYTGEADGVSESKAFAKIVKKFFEEAKPQLKS